MKVTKEFLNVTQLLLNSLTEGINLQTYYLFTPYEARQLIRALDTIFTGNMRHVWVSFYYNPKMDQTVSFKVFKTNLGYSRPLINYLNDEVKDFLNSKSVGVINHSLVALINNHLNN